MKPRIVIGLLAWASLLAAQEPAIGGGGYGGPSILSRGVSPAGRRGEETLRFRVFGQVNSLYDTGLLPVSTTAEGKPYSDALWGVEGVLGVYGYHNFRHSTLGLDYRGNYRHYNQKSYYDGSDHLLTLDYMTQPSRRVAITLRPTVGTFSRSYGNFGYYASMPTSEVVGGGVPANELFDNRNYFLQQAGNIVYQKSARLSFSASGEAFLVRRQSKALVDLNGFTTTGDVAYRLNRNQTVFLAYNYVHYAFPGVFGSTDAQMALAGHSLRIGRNVEFSVAGGGMRIESKGLRTVAVDPAIAALVGQSSTIQAFYRINYLPSISASLSRSFRKSRVSASYGQGISPGNGFFLTSRSQTLGIFGGYTGIRRWDFSGGVYYSKLQGMGFVNGGYGNFSGGGSASFRVNNLLHLSARVDSRRADLTTSGFRRDAIRLSFGFTITPGELPVSIW